MVTSISEGGEGRNHAAGIPTGCIVPGKGDCRSKMSIVTHCGHDGLYFGPILRVALAVRALLQPFPGGELQMFGFKNQGQLSRR